MSHKATNWAISQRGLKPATKIILWCLADCHNPHFGCFPSMSKLAEDSEMSRRSVVSHIQELESAGLIKVISGGVDANGKFKSNRYLLAFEDDFQNVPDRAQNLPAAEIAVGKNEQEPCANFSDDRAQNLRSNPVRVNPVKEPTRASALKKSSSSDYEELRQAGILSWMRGERGLPPDWLTKERIGAMKRDGLVNEDQAKNLFGMCGR